jgi:hypothetical protein
MRPVIALTLFVLVLAAGLAAGWLEHRYTGVRVAGHVTDVVLGVYMTLFGFRVIHKTLDPGKPTGLPVETWRGPCKVLGPLVIALGLLGLAGL